MNKPSLFSRHSGSLIIFSVTVLAAIAGQWLYHLTQDKVPDLSKLDATVFSTPRTITPFSLLNQNGQSFTEASLQGQWSFIFFGYTNCPDVCPTTLTTLNLMLKAITNQSADIPLPRVIMVSVDPERDTVEQLGKYMPYFNKNFTGLTANTQADVDALVTQFGVPYLLNKESADDMEYSVEHSGALLLINPQGKLHALFSGPHEPIKLANEFATIRGLHE